MSTADLVRRMAAAGAPAEAIAIALEAIDAASNEAKEIRRKNAERRARQRAVSRDSRSTVASLSQSDPSPKERSPTPPKEITPSRSEDKSSSLSPRDELRMVLDDDRAAAVLDHRKRLRKPLTARAAQLLAGKLAKAPNSNAAADLMIERGWLSFEPEWVDRRQRDGPRSQPNVRPSFLSVAAKMTGHDQPHNDPFDLNAGHDQPEPRRGHAPDYDRGDREQVLDLKPVRSDRR